VTLLNATRHLRPRRRRPARLAALVAAAAGVALVGGLASPARADAAACSTFTNMTVGAAGGIAGIPVTGASCTDVGNGEVEIENPRLLSAEAVEIRGNMILSLDRTRMRQKLAGLPLVAAVKNSGGDYQPFILGTLAVFQSQICDIFPAQNQGISGVLTPEGLPLELRTNDESKLVLQQTNCRQGVGLGAEQPLLKTTAKLLKVRPRQHAADPRRHIRHHPGLLRPR